MSNDIKFLTLLYAILLSVKDLSFPPTSVLYGLFHQTKNLSFFVM